MRTDELLNLDCTKQENKTKLNKFLFKIKPVQKKMGTQKGIVPLEVLEECLHGIEAKYNYREQGMLPYFEGDKFHFYMVSMLKKRETSVWIGNVYGKTLWEVTAKMIIKVYADILRERREENE